MKIWIRYLCVFFIIHLLPLISLGQPIVDGFDYPIGDFGYNSQGIKTPLLEKLIPEVNNIYPFKISSNNCRATDCSSNKESGKWYCSQDIGSYWDKQKGFHNGEDWLLYGLNCIGQEVKAIASGKIVYIGKVNYGGDNLACGWLIIIKHLFKNGEVIYSLYAHITSKESKDGYLVKTKEELGFEENQDVEKGQTIGRIATITAFIPHLHFEIRAINGYNLGTSCHWCQNDKSLPCFYYSTYSDMIKDGLIDPSDFIDGHRNSIGVGYYSENDWRNDGISMSFLNCYNRNGGINSIGDPYDNGGGPFVHSFLFKGETIYLQDFKTDNNKLSTICYIPKTKEAFHLKGCIWFLWWTKTSSGKSYYDYLGLPKSDEEKSTDSSFEIMQRFENGKIFWRRECKENNENVKIEFTNFQNGNECIVCQPDIEYLECSCVQNNFTKSASLIPNCDQFFSALYLQKTSWDFGNEDSNGWTGRNATDLGFGENWYWIIDPLTDPDPISGSGIVSPPFLSSVNTDLYNQVEIRVASKSHFMETVQLHLLIDGEWKPPVLMNCISQPATQLPNNQCIYNGSIPYPGQIQQFRIDFIEGSDLINDQIFVDYVKFIEGANPVPTLVAAFASDVQYGKFPFTVRFTDTSQTKSVTSPISYEWDFGDGNKSSVQSPNHVYTEPGEYSVSLKILSGIYNNTIVQSNYIHIFESSPVTNLEYFFDEDPGQGKGISINGVPTEDFSQSFDVNYSDLVEGYHTLFIRAKDGSGKWGTVASKPFYALHIDDIPYITQMEYFFDSDPGQGKGNQITINSGNWEEQNIILDFTGLTEGYHTLFVRTKNNFDKWGTIASKPFYRITGSNHSNISQIEYYIDDDPGIGRATIESVNPSIVLEHNIFLDLNSLNQGNHSLGVRARNGYFNWSDTFIQPFAYKSVPIADAGMNQSVNEGAMVTLDGSASSDPDGNDLTYRWTAPVGIHLSSTTVAKPTFTAPEVSSTTNYTFSLVVNDGTVDSPVDQVVITIQNVNKVPLADAGIDQSVNEGTIVTLDGSASSDPDGNDLTYRWTAPVGIPLSSTTEAMPTFIAPEVYKDSTLSFSMLVNDGVINSLPDTVKVTVLNDTSVGVALIESPLFKIYPNPTTGLVNLEFYGNTNKKSVVLVTNLLGAEIFRKVVNDADKIQIDLSNQMNGIYLLKVTISDRQYVSKVVVRKE